MLQRWRPDLLLLPPPFALLGGLRDGVLGRRARLTGLRPRGTGLHLECEEDTSSGREVFVRVAVTGVSASDGRAVRFGITFGFATASGPAATEDDSSELSDDESTITGLGASPP